MSALLLTPLLVFCAAGLGFTAARIGMRPPAPPPRGFRPVVIAGGKTLVPTPREEHAP
ncbi:hypothetical protein [Acidocella sp.]|uniref:hypothetical protein n=1 Tax=Acidocella sp. TaxID=50710 RepID=UPI003CFDA039